MSFSSSSQSRGTQGKSRDSLLHSHGYSNSCTFPLIRQSATKSSSKSNRILRNGSIDLNKEKYMQRRAELCAINQIMSLLEQIKLEHHRCHKTLCDPDMKQPYKPHGGV